MAPSVGRIVHYHVEGSKGQPYPAVITHVWSPTYVNLNVIDDGTFPLEYHKPTSVELLEEGQRKHGRWSWPPKIE